MQASGTHRHQALPLLVSACIDVVTDVFAVQDEIATAVVSELKLKLLGVALKPREVDPKSYLLSLQARDINRQGTAAASKQAMSLYEQALAVDSSNTAAWVGLADAVYLEVASGWRQPKEGSRLARKALERALSVDPEYAEAHRLLADIAVAHDLDYVAAVQRAESNHRHADFQSQAEF